MNECVWQIAAEITANVEGEREQAENIELIDQDESKEIPRCNYAVAQSTSIGLKKWSICYRSSGWIIAAEWNITSSKSTALALTLAFAFMLRSRRGLSVSSGDLQSFAARLYSTVYTRILFMFRVPTLLIASACVHCDWSIEVHRQRCSDRREEAKCMYSKQLWASDRVWVRASAYKSNEMWLLRV